MENRPTKLELSIGDTEATWYSTTKIESMSAFGHEVYLGLSQGRSGFSRIPKAIRDTYLKLLTPETLPTASFIIEPASEHEAHYKTIS